ncbi:AzlC family ABC transporter permease [Amycolatopsis minnesotensis]|uniref:AzlC family ABC transporter permease n=1 Tax=Amycolatopsis minnesotensis TaxID=337894 RepID=A0ABN2S3A8_9PSEU
MRSIWRTLGPELGRDIGLVCLADCLVGASYGVLAVSSGFEIWVPMMLSLLVFAGAAQFLFIGMIAAGGNPIAAVVAGLLVNTRHVPFGFAVAEVLGDGVLRRMAGSHLMIDENVAFSLAQKDAERRRVAYWACGVGLFVCWNLGVVAGAFAGTAITDTDAFGLDAAFPAVLCALVLPSLKDRETRLAVLIGVVVALATTFFLPAGLPVLCAVVGVLVVLRKAKATETSEVAA